MQTASIDQWRRPGPTADQRRIDVLVGVAVAVLGLFNVVLSDSIAGLSTGQSRPEPPPLWEQCLWSAAVTLPLIWRRVRPELTVVVVAVAFIAAQARGCLEQQVASGAIFAAIFAVGAWGPDRRRARVLRGVVIAAMFVWLGVAWWLAKEELVALIPREGAAGALPPLLAGMLNGILINMLIFGFAYLFGETAWLAARRQHQLEVQAEQLRAAQRSERERAVMGERVRIARELHDVVAHHVSVMGIQAAAGRRVLDRDPAKARTALAAVEQSARTAVEELRRMLGALRAPDGEVGGAGQPPDAAGIERLDDLVQRVRDAGLVVQYGVYGEPVPVPESVSQAVYRIVQEAVTNTLKHAAASMIDIRIRYLANTLEIDVADDGRGGHPDGTGMGLLGMAERIAVHDGTLQAGPRADGGFRVRASLTLVRADAMVGVAP